MAIQFHTPSPCLFCSVVSLNSQGYCFHLLLSRHVFLNRLYWHYVGKDEDVCSPKFNLLEDHRPIWKTTDLSVKQLHPTGVLGGFQSQQAVWSLDHLLPHPCVCISIVSWGSLMCGGSFWNSSVEGVKTQPLDIWIELNIP